MKIKIHHNSITRNTTAGSVHSHRFEQRGTVLVAFIAFLLMSEIAILGLVLNTARHQYVAVDRLDTIRAFYASEGGMNMAIREIMINSDEDGDGVIGTISDDSNSSTDPQIGAGTTFVTSQIVSTTRTLTGVGSSGQAIRKLTAVLEY